MRKSGQNLWQLGRGFLKILGLAACLVGAAPAHAAAWQANDDDAILLDGRIGEYRVGDGIRGYQTGNGAICVDFADIIMAFDLPVRLDKKSRRATGWLFEEQRLFTLDRDLNKVQIMGKSQELAANEIYDTPEGWCVATPTLARWLGVEVKADLSNSLLLMKSDHKLPFELAEERKTRAGNAKPIAQFNLDKLPQADDAFRFWRTPSVDVVANAELHREAHSDAHIATRFEILASGEIAQASVEARLSSDESGIPNSLRMRAYRYDPKGDLLGPLAATQIAVGDIATYASVLGVQSMTGRGGYISNRPLERADNFDRTNFRGDLPEGWDAELYHNGQLIGYMHSRGDGRYEFLEIPLHYGQNRFEVVLYGPQGQLKRSSKLIPVGLDSIPPRETYYWAGVQDTDRDLINLNGRDKTINSGLRAGIGIERGIDAKTSISASYNSALYRSRRRNYLEASIRRAIGPALVQMTAASNVSGGYALHGQALAQLGDSAISFEAATFENGYESERFEADLHRFVNVAIDHDLKIAGGQVPLHLEAGLKQYLDGRCEWTGKSRVSFNIKQLNISADLQWNKQESSNILSIGDRLSAGVQLSGRIGSVRLRGEAEFGLIGDAGFRESKITADWRAGERADWRTEIGYEAAASRGHIGFGYTRRFDKFALTGQVEAASDGSVSAGISLAFSLGPDPRNGGIRMASEKLASNGQAYAIVFDDENGDGVRQSDEPLEKSVELTAGLGGRSLPTDSQGRTLIDGLQPFQPILIGIDSATLSDPYMQPANSGLVVTPRPGVALQIELPLVPSGEISGQLNRDNGRSLGGMDLELIDKAGRVVKTVRSEFDGYFIFEGVPYGHYTVRLMALSAGIMGLQANLDRTADLGRGNGSVEIGTVIAHSAEHIASAAAQNTEQQ